MNLRINDMGVRDLIDLTLRLRGIWHAFIALWDNRHRLWKNVLSALISFINGQGHGMPLLYYTPKNSRINCPGQVKHVLRMTQKRTVTSDGPLLATRITSTCRKTTYHGTKGEGYIIGRSAGMIVRDKTRPNAGHCCRQMQDLEMKRLGESGWILKKCISLLSLHPLQSLAAL